MSSESFKAFEKANKEEILYEDNFYLRGLLLDFIADFANWDNSTDEHYLETSRALTDSAHIANGGEPETRPLVLDPFAGGGAIPLEALRIGADAFASDLNPVAVLLNKVTLEYIPKYGQPLADEVRKWGKWVKEEAEKELGEFYPKDSDGSIPIAYLWARTIVCEGPGCGAKVPLMPSSLIAKRKNNSVGLRLQADEKTKDIEVILEQPTTKAFNKAGTVAKGSVTCPRCKYTTPIASVRRQLISVKGGANEARLLAIQTIDSASRRKYRTVLETDLSAIAQAKLELKRRQEKVDGYVTVPDEELPLMSGVFNVPLYGHDTWGSMFTSRQALLLTTLARIVRDLAKQEAKHEVPIDVLTSILALAVDRQADYLSSICTWVSSGEFVGHTFAQGQSLPIKFDFAEVSPLAGGSGSWMGAIEWIARVCESCSAGDYEPGAVHKLSASDHSLPDDSVDALITDPPYYNAVPYADLSDFFYVWLKRILKNVHVDLFANEEAPKDDEITEMAGWDSRRYAHKDKAFYEDRMRQAMSEGRRILKPSGVGLVVFAHKSTTGWEAQLQAMVDAGWIITASWAIDTERSVRLRAMDSAALASSIHLVCRPRENADGSVGDEIGDWRDVLRELPIRIHEWMPRLANEGVVGADAIFACLGPALEIFSRYSGVEKPNGETVTLREYLEHVWAAVAKEALDMIFAGADATGFEEDARITAMWLWTLFSGASTAEANEESEEGNRNDEENGGSKKKATGYLLEYDAARKIAQGLGAHLEDLNSIVEIKGDKARLLPVGERARDLFGLESSEQGAMTTGRRKKSKAQGKLFTEMEDDEFETVFGVGGVPSAASTTLDRVHQTMLLFGAGRGEAVKRFLVDDGIGNDERFWRLADNLSKLYPSGSEEKRWVDGVLARKKGLGF
ncbi:MAG: hypothetical protein WAU71_09565 [Pyrinomonadaceae bacterium]